MPRKSGCVSMAEKDIVFCADKALRIGVVVTTHALKGELKIFPTTDDPKRFDDLKRCFIKTRDGVHMLEPEKVRYFKQFVIIKFKGYDNINDVLTFVKKDILVNREDAVELEEGEYFICDLVGNTVMTDTGERLGILADVITSAANNVYIVKRDDGKELLIPVIPDCIVGHDTESKVTTVHLLDGLLDL